MLADCAGAQQIANAYAKPMASSHAAVWAMTAGSGLIQLLPFPNTIFRSSALIILPARP